MAHPSIRAVHKALENLSKGAVQTQIKQFKIDIDRHTVVRNGNLLFLKYNGITYGKVSVVAERYPNPPSRELAEEAVEVIGRYYQRMLDQETVAKTQGIDLVADSLGAVTRSQLMMAVYICLALDGFCAFKLHDEFLTSAGDRDGWKLHVGKANGEKRVCLIPVG